MNTCKKVSRRDAWAKPLLFGFVFLYAVSLCAQNVFSVKGNRTYLNDKEFQAIGLRCSNALFSDQSVNELVSHLDEYKKYGVNTISVFFMGSRFSEIHGYNADGTLKPVYQLRMGKIIEACDERGMVTLVGILYWGSGMHDRTNKNYEGWKQDHVEAAMQHTVKWLHDNKYRNVFIDPDNEGMAEIGAKFDIAKMICAGKKINPAIAIAYNGKGAVPACAGLTVHFGLQSDNMPYIQTEGTPSQYWGEYSKENGLSTYINAGIYTKGKKKEQLADTKRLLDKGHGYLFASTWLQNIPPKYEMGGDGSPADPGIRWWLDYIKERTPTPGAAVSYSTYEAEAASNKITGEVIRFNNTETPIIIPEMEASGRAYVELVKQGQFLELASQENANTIVVRFCTPDAPAGGGTNSTLSLYVNNIKQQTLVLNSRHAWLYGSKDVKPSTEKLQKENAIADETWQYGRLDINGRSNDPRANAPHVYWDEAHFFS